MTDTERAFRSLGIESACVLTLTSICFNGRLTMVPFRTFKSFEDLRELVILLLDNGIEVETYWKNIDYSVLSKKLPPGERT